ncbi:MAG: N-acetylneuraminate synthase family protein [Phycisphaerales bacterium]
MRIGVRQIGEGAHDVGAHGAAPVYVIAELGVNHDGSPARALELTEAAARAGADAIKLQLFRADLLMSAASELAGYQKSAGERDPREMLRRLELPIGAMAEVVGRAHELGLHAIVTPFSVELVAEAERMGGGDVGWDAYKTASPDVVHRPLLRALLATGKPMIVSTGAADLGEVSRAAGWLASATTGPHGRVAMLQCVSCYPTADEDAAIRGMEAIRGVFGGPVGYSDHTRGVDTGAVAAGLGAAILEKHLTLSRALPGPDHAASLEPEEFRTYATLARDESAMRAWMSGGAAAAGGVAAGERERVPMREDRRWGEARKVVLACERDVRRVSRQSITAKGDLPQGHRLEAKDVTFKRPGIGLEPWRLDEVVGRRLRRAVGADWPIMAEDVA